MVNAAHVITSARRAALSRPMSDRESAFVRATRSKANAARDLAAALRYGLTLSATFAACDLADAESAYQVAAARIDAHALALAYQGEESAVRAALNSRPSFLALALNF